MRELLSLIRKIKSIHPAFKYTLDDDFVLIDGRLDPFLRKEIDEIIYSSFEGKIYEVEWFDCSDIRGISPYYGFRIIPETAKII